MCRKRKSTFIGLAYVLPMKQKFLHHCPEAIYVNTVSHTYKDKRLLFTISGRETFGKMFVILRTFVPGERAWVFQCIFVIVMPRKKARLHPLICENQKYTPN